MGRYPEAMARRKAKREARKPPLGGPLAWSQAEEMELMMTGTYSNGNTYQQGMPEYPYHQDPETKEWKRK